MEPSTITELVDQLARLHHCSENTSSDCKTPNDSKTVDGFSSNTVLKLQAYSSVVEANERVIDPAIRKLREKLPIFKKKDELLKAIHNNQVLIIIGETGSGKTTQIPQYLLEAGVGITGRVGCTQLRRMAAKAVAKRVAQEQGCKVGDEVGFTIRFEDCTNEKTKIQYMTDGILLRECTYDRMLTSYSAIILDESHERTIDTDVLLAVLKWVLKKRNDLKLVISSATLDARKFSTYFFDAFIFEISGRMFPVEINYEPSYPLEYLDKACRVIQRINEREPPGDILVFLTGEDDIEDLHEMLLDYRNSLAPKLEVLPCYSALPWDQQKLIFQPTSNGKRKVILATNIAETSLTVDGIKFVIDSGHVKQKVYDAKREMEVLKKIKVSQAQAIQRSGRAGRTAPGKCYRLYSYAEYDSFISDQDPEIRRSSLTSSTLLLKKMGFNDLYDFDFLDEPPKEALDEALSELELFGAIEHKLGMITEVGKKMASFPLDPSLAKMLIISEQLGCAEDMLTIVALLSVPNIFFRPRKKQKEADAAKAEFMTSEGDLVMNLRVYNQWRRYDTDEQWCYLHFVQARMMKEAHNVRGQLFDIMKSRDMTVVSSLPYTVPILKSICAGFFQNVAQKAPSIGKTRFSYFTLPKREQVYIFPGSALFKRSEPEWVVYQKVLRTKKDYMRGISPIELSWLKEFSPAFDLKINPKRSVGRGIHKFSF